MVKMSNFWRILWLIPIALSVVIYQIYSAASYDEEALRKEAFKLQESRQPKLSKDAPTYKDRYSTPPYFTENSYARFAVVLNAWSHYIRDSGEIPDSLEDLKESGYMFYNPEVAGLKIEKEGRARGSISFDYGYKLKDGTLKVEPYKYSYDLMDWAYIDLPIEADYRKSKIRKLRQRKADRIVRDRELKSYNGDEKALRTMERFEIFYFLHKNLLEHYFYMKGKYPKTLDELEPLVGGRIEKAWFNEMAGQPIKNSPTESVGDYFYTRYIGPGGKPKYQLNFYYPKASWKLDEAEKRKRDKKKELERPIIFSKYSNELYTVYSCAYEDFLQMNLRFPKNVRELEESGYLFYKPVVAGLIISSEDGRSGTIGYDSKEYDWITKSIVDEQVRIKRALDDQVTTYPSSPVPNAGRKTTCPLRKEPRRYQDTQARAGLRERRLGAHYDQTADL